jgi:hypothetical protein
MPEPSPGKIGRNMSSRGAVGTRGATVQDDGPLSPLGIIDSDEDFQSADGEKMVLSPVPPESETLKVMTEADAGAEVRGVGRDGGLEAEKSENIAEHNEQGGKEDGDLVPPANEDAGDRNEEDDEDDDDNDKVWVAETKTKNTKKTAPGRAKKHIEKKKQVPKQSAPKKTTAKRSAGGRKTTPENSKAGSSSSKTSSPAAEKKLPSKGSTTSQRSEMQDSGPVTPQNGKAGGVQRAKQGSSEKKPVLKLLSAGKQIDKEMRKEKSSDKESESSSGRKLGIALFHPVPKSAKKSTETRKPAKGIRKTPVSKVSKTLGNKVMKGALPKGPKTAKMASRKVKETGAKLTACKTPRRKLDDQDSHSKAALQAKKLKTSMVDTDDEDEVSPARTTIDAEEDESDENNESEDEEVVPALKRPYLGGIAYSSADLTTRDLVDATVKSLGGYCCARPENASLFIAGEVRRGPALLTAISRGIPVLNQAFLTKAISDGKWPTEWSSFEQHAGAKQSRLTKENPKGVGFLKDKRIKLSGPLSIDTAALSLMIRESGGRVVSTREDIVLSDSTASPGVSSVSLKWFADSIEEQRMMPFESYRIPV